MISLAIENMRKEAVRPPGIMPARSEMGNLDTIFLGRALVDGQLLDIDFFAVS